MAKFVGSQFIEDIAAFLTDFQFVLGGFLERAQSIDRLLRQPTPPNQMVMTPDVSAVDEALFFANRLAEATVPLAAFIANRVQARPDLTDTDADSLSARLNARPEIANIARADIDTTALRLARTALDFQKLADGQRRELKRLAAAVPGIPIWEVPLLDREVGSLRALRTVGEHLDPERP
jgi:anion-transporting  ArsA/GET3 family ATPase